jgi:hypothetical protein
MLVVGVALAHLRGGLAFSSSFERPVPAPPIAVRRLLSSGGAWPVLPEWCFRVWVVFVSCGGLAPWCWRCYCMIFARFPILTGHLLLN